MINDQQLSEAWQPVCICDPATAHSHDITAGWRGDQYAIPTQLTARPYLSVVGQQPPLDRPAPLAQCLAGYNGAALLVAGDLPLQIAQQIFKRLRLLACAAQLLGTAP